MVARWIIGTRLLCQNNFGNSRYEKNQEFFWNNWLSSRNNWCKNYIAYSEVLKLLKYNTETVQAYCNRAITYCNKSSEIYDHTSNTEVTYSRVWNSNYYGHVNINNRNNFENNM